MPENRYGAVPATFSDFRLCMPNGDRERAVGVRGGGCVQTTHARIARISARLETDTPTHFRLTPPVVHNLERRCHKTGTISNLGHTGSVLP
ncbi:hypothetical protein MRX96_020196 [Rhipicephalus microplus]